MSWWRRRRQLVCQQAVELVSDYLEGALSPRDRERFEAHLAGCPHCTAYLEQMRTTITTLGHLDPEGLPPAVLDEIVAVYRRLH
jgi:anti-sigma factor RsiW